MASDQDDYDVGYGKPPKSTRFSPGVSGNPAGAPRKRKQVPAMDRALEQKVDLMVNGKRRRIPVVHAVIYQMVEQALKGDPAARREVLRLYTLSQKSKANNPGHDGAIVNFSVKGLYDGTLNTLKMLCIIEETPRGIQKLQPWTVDASVRNRGYPLNKDEKRMVAEAIKGHRSS